VAELEECQESADDEAIAGGAAGSDYDAESASERSVVGSTVLIYCIICSLLT